MIRHKKLPRGVFGRNSEYWIRYTDQHGKLHREKVGPFLEQAKAAVQKRRSEVREGKFFPEKIKKRVVLFGELAKEQRAAPLGRLREPETPGETPVAAVPPSH